MHNPTIFLDIDGTLLKHRGDLRELMIREPEVLKGVYAKLNEWEAMGCRIILTTGRKESQRAITIQQLDKCGIFYDQLIMGIGGGPRYIINDRKGDGSDTCFAINVDRNAGLENVTLDSQTE